MSYRILSAVFLLTLWSCQSTTEVGTPKLEGLAPPVAASAAMPEWAKDAAIYEVNIRQHTPEGTFKAFTADMDRIVDLGSDILWLMPMFPISEAERKGPLGSPYAVADYTTVNPEFGTEADFQALVDRAHELGMRVILDFVPNHTGWDHAWISDQPDWYTQNEAGEIIDPIEPETGESWGWTDVADLNHGNPDMRAAMIDDLVYLIETFDIDGYRMDVAHQVPDVFWAELTPRLRAAKADVFMLAEAEIPSQLNQEFFAANYGWEFHHIINGIAQGDSSAEQIKSWFEEFDHDHEYGFQMQFITNHDENSWSGTVRERMGNNWQPMAVLTNTIEGMPLIYSGQEAGLDHQLRFFSKDTISFADTSRYGFYRSLQELKTETKALWNGSYGASPQFLETATDPKTTIAYARVKGEHGVLVLLNFGDSSADFVLPQVAHGRYIDAFTEAETIVSEAAVTVAANGYRLLKF
ncbi:MAG: alpha-amylase family glycosyl hydrolase [Bacteroidota bacterium]